MAFNPETARPVGSKSTGKFDPSTARPVGGGSQKEAFAAKTAPFHLAGPLSMGGGVTPRDLPFVLSKIGSGLLGGIPETAARNPLGGIPENYARFGASLVGAKGKSPIDLFPEAATGMGRVLGESLGFAIPSAMFGAKGIEKVAEKTGQVLQKARKAEEAPGLITKAIKEVEIAVKAKGKGLDKAAKLAEKRGAREVAEASAKIDSQVDNLAATIVEKADDATLKIRPVFIEYIKGKSREFGAGMRRVIERFGKPIPRQRVVDALESTIDSSGIREKLKNGGKLSPAENEVLALLGRLKRGAVKQPKVIPAKPEVRDVMGVLMKKATPEIRPKLIPDNIDPKLLASEMSRITGKYAGKKYTSGEHIVSLFQESLSEAIEEFVPGMAKFRSSHAPYLRFKQKAFGILKPFVREGEFETGAGVRLFKSIAEGKVDPDDARFVSELGKRLGPKFVDKFRMIQQKTAGLVAEKGKVAQRVGEKVGKQLDTISAQRARIVEDAANKIEDLQKQLEVAQTAAQKVAIIRKIEGFVRRIVEFGAIRQLARGVPLRAVK